MQNEHETFFFFLLKDVIKNKVLWGVHCFFDGRGIVNYLFFNAEYCNRIAIAAEDCNTFTYLTKVSRITAANITENQKIF